MTSIEKLKNHRDKICVIGLGYVGLPVALELAVEFSVIGFDVNASRVALMKQHIDPSNELTEVDFLNRNIHFTADPEEISEARFFIVAVPTPIDKNKSPNLRPLLSACEYVGNALKKGDVVVFESTVYPGCTEEDCVPILEMTSGLKFRNDFYVGYSPERINPGDKEHTLRKITKVVSGCGSESLKLISEVYGSIIDAGIFKASSIKVAEASKIIENTQRDLNIALMNELSLIFKKMDINTYEVLEASGTKWNFLKFSPGLVGGHCIGVDPYYLTHKADELGIHAKVITAGRAINDAVSALVAREIVQYLISTEKPLTKTRVLVMGVTFKENVSDIRNSKVPELINELKAFSVQVDAIDPHADRVDFEKEYGITLADEEGSNYDAIILAVNHKKYLNKTSEAFISLSKKGALLYDIKGVYRDQLDGLTYKSL